MKRRFSTVALLFLGYAVIILIGSAILSLPAADSAKVGHRYIDCLFTSVSATCVTGLIPFDTATGWSIFGQSVILFLIQLGGLGFMTAISLFFMAFGRRITLHDQNILMKSQGSHTVGDIIPLIRKVCILTFGTEALGTALLFLRFRAKFGMKGLYYALFTSVSAFCNAGFDVFGTGSLTEFRSDGFVLLTVSFLILAGGLGFVVYSDLHQKRFNLFKCNLHTKTVLLANGFLVLFGTAFFYLLEFTDIGAVGAFSDLPFGEKLLNAFFLAVSPRTAGFNAVDLTRLSGSGQFMTIILMLIGGNSCSTAGGIKVTTVVVVLANLAASARKSKDVRIFKKRVPEETVRQAGAVLLSYLLLLVISVSIIGIFESADLNSILFECSSAIATVGLTLNLTPSLGTVAKLVLIFLMYFGRLGAFSAFELLIGREKKENFQRPEGRIMVG